MEIRPIMMGNMSEMEARKSEQWLSNAKRPGKKFLAEEENGERETGEDRRLRKQ